MAKLYHNGEYLKNGGEVIQASAIQTYYVELTEPTSASNRILIPQDSLSYPHKLHIYNKSDNFIDMSSIYVIDNKANLGDYPIRLSAPAFFNLNPASDISNYYVQPTEMITTRLKSKTSHEFEFVIPYGYIQTDKYYTHHLMGQTSGYVPYYISMYTEEALPRKYPMTFIVAGSISSTKGNTQIVDDTNAILTIGTIYIPPNATINNNIRIRQESIFGDVTINKIYAEDMEGHGITSDGWYFEPPFVIDFRLGSSKLGFNAKLSMHLFI